MSRYTYSRTPKPATDFTRKVQCKTAIGAGLRPECPENRELELASAHLIRKAEHLQIKDDSGRVIWDLDAFSFLDNAAPSPEVHPSLWLNGRANRIAGLFEVVPEKIYQVRGFDLANLTLVRSQTGWIVMDCMTNVETARAAMDFASDTLGEDISARVRAVVISHSHLDHYGGLRGVADPQKLGTEIPIIVPAGYNLEVVREHVFAGKAMSRRKKYQVGARDAHSGPQDIVSTGIGLTHPTGHASFIRPTISVDKDGPMVVDGLTLDFMLTPEAEAPVEMITYFPAYRALWMAELCNGTLHNLYPIRGAQVRDGLAWSQYLTDALVRWGQATDVVFQSHNWPHWNTSQFPHDAQDYLCRTAAAYRWIHDQTLLYANQGSTPREIAAGMHLPDGLAQCGYLRPYYGSLEINARAVYQKYLGFYDGNPVHLNPLTEQQSARHYVDYMGGADAILSKAEADFAQGNYQWVAEVTQQLIFAQPDCEKARLLCADAMEQLGYQAESGIWRNAYLTAASELRFGTESSGGFQKGNHEVLEQLSPDFLLDQLGILLDGERAQNENLCMNLTVADGDTLYRYVLLIRWGVLLTFRNTQKPEAPSLSISKDVLLALSHHRLSAFAEQLSPEDYALLRRLESLLADWSGQPPFAIIEP